MGVSQKRHVAICCQSNTEISRLSAADVGSTVFFRRCPNTKSMNTNPIPENLLNFVPMDSGFASGPPHWIASKDIVEHCIDVKRQQLVPMSSVWLSIVLFVILATLLVYLNVVFHVRNVDFLRLVVLNLSGGVIAIFTPLVVLCIYAWATYDNSSYWKGALHFRYRLNTQELFFPRENQIYLQKECERIIMVHIIGYDLRGQVKRFGLYGAPGNHQFSANTRHQTCILVLLNTGRWERHEIGYDLYRAKRQFDKLVEMLQPLTNCEVIVKKYTRDECYDQQHAKIQTPNEPTNKKILW
jgi:hypothetical protein